MTVPSLQDKVRSPFRNLFPHRLIHPVSAFKQKLLYLRSQIEGLPVLFHGIISDFSLFPVTRQCALRHAEQFRQIHIVQQPVTVHAFLQAVHLIQFLFNPGKAFHHCSYQSFEYLIIYVRHNSMY